VESRTGETRLSYDHLVYALGSTIDCQSVRGVQDHAYRLTPTGPFSAAALRLILPDVAAKGGHLVVVGGGATGIEAAAEFKDAYPQLEVSLVAHGEFGAFTTPKVARYMRKALNRLRVQVVDRTTVTAVESGRVLIEADAPIACDLCLWTGGFRVSALARDAGIRVNALGQVLVDPFLRSISHPNVIAIGDAAKPVANPGAPMRMSAVTAVITGAHAADCLAAELKGRQPKPLGFAWLGQGISLGRHDAVGLNNYPDDVQKGPIFTGRLAVGIREFFVRFLSALPAFERRWPGFFIWLGKRRGSPAVSIVDAGSDSAAAMQGRALRGRNGRHEQLSGS
jgi:NADH dehydrogenase FAD-containing subunit